MTHTPGPWGIHPLDELAVVVAGRGAMSSQIPIADCCERDDADSDVAREQALANAKLIASAPSLLAACKAALDVLYDRKPFNIEKLRDQLHAAIAEAEPAAVDGKGRG